MDDTSIGSLDYDQPDDATNGGSVGGASVRSRFSTGPRGDGGDGMDALAAFAIVAARNESIHLDDPEPLESLDQLSTDGSRRSRRQSRATSYFHDEDDNASRRSRDSMGSRKRKAGGHQGGGVGDLDFLGAYDDDDSLAGVSIRSGGGGGGGKRSSSRASQQGLLLPLPSGSVSPGPLLEPAVPMLLGTADNPVMTAIRASNNRRNQAAASVGRKPQEESKADAVAPARALVNDRWAENPRLTMLVNSLSSRMRHFAMFEWFYSTIDRDYFNHNEFQDCLDHLDLRHVHKLTRTEWSAFRSALGRPRRLSPAFLGEERAKLEGYRRVIRDVQRRAIPTPPADFGYEVPVPIVVGQNVSAYHKRAKLLSRGQVLTADYERGIFRVQFERPELGSEVCSDTQLAVHGPPSLMFARPTPRGDDMSTHSTPLPFYTGGGGGAGGGTDYSSSDHQQQPLAGVGVGQVRADGAMVMGHQPVGPLLLGTDELAVVQSKLLSFTAKMLERKEMLLNTLRDMNQQAEQMSAPAPVRHPSLYSASFRQHYTWVVAALNKTNIALNPALEKLRLTVFADAQLDGSAEGSSGEADVHFGVRVPIHVKTLLEASQRAAKVLVHNHKLKMGWNDPWPGGEEGRRIEVLIEACTSLILVLRRCAEQIRANLLSPADVDPCLKAALQEIRSRASGTSQRLLSEIEASVALLKTDLLA